MKEILRHIRRRGELVETVELLGHESPSWFIDFEYSSVEVLEVDLIPFVSAQASRMALIMIVFDTEIWLN